LVALATPFVIVIALLPKLTLSAKNVTRSPAVAVGVTVAVSCTFWPKMEGLGADIRVVVEAVPSPSRMLTLLLPSLAVAISETPSPLKSATANAMGSRCRSAGCLWGRAPALQNLPRHLRAEERG